MLDVGLGYGGSVGDVMEQNSECASCHAISETMWAAKCSMDDS